MVVPRRRDTRFMAYCCRLMQLILDERRKEPLRRHGANCRANDARTSDVRVIRGRRSKECRNIISCINRADRANFFCFASLALESASPLLFFFPSERASGNFWMTAFRRTIAASAPTPREGKKVKFKTQRHIDTFCGRMMSQRKG